MNLTTPVLKGMIRAAELPGDSVTSLVQKIGTTAGLFGDDDGGLGMVMSALAGIATALAVAILLSVYFRTGYRSTRDVVKHGLAAALMLALVAFVAYDMRQAALSALSDRVSASIGVSSGTTTLEPNDDFAIRYRAL